MMNSIKSSDLEIILKNKNVLGITGMRPNKLGGYKDCDLHDFIKKELNDNINCDILLTGMAQGVDTWAAEACIKNNIKYAAIIPFMGQEKLWPINKQKKYNELLNKASYTCFLSFSSYTYENMQIRNEWIVDHCSNLLAVWDGNPGGTGNCVKYAKKQGFEEVSDFSKDQNKKVKIINPDIFAM